MAQAISDDLENFELEEAVRHIVEASARLKCSFLTRCNTLLIYHNFKRCTDEYPYDPCLVATACVTLSVKSMEDNITFESVILVFLSMFYRQNYSTEEIIFKLARRSVTLMESFICRMLQFDLTYDTAFRYLPFFMNDIREELMLSNSWDVFVKTCMRFSSDFYLSKRCINYKAEEIAVTVVEVGLQYIGIDVDNKCHLGVWLKALHDCPESTKCDIMEDIFKICDIGPVAESKREAVRALAVQLDKFALQ